MNHDFSNYSDLLNETKKYFRNERKDETFLSICGYPHYERVASSILAFFLDSEREHGFKDLFVKSLLECIGKHIDVYGRIFAQREIRTTKGNFIDVLVECDEFCIVIENKIYAKVYNDLEDYFNFAQTRVKSRNVYGLVLGLKEQTLNSKNFRFVTYDELFKKIENNLGSYVIAANQKYCTFLYDFIQNIKNLYKGIPMNGNLLKFFDEEKSEISQKFIDDVKQLRKDMRNKVKKINELVKERTKDIPDNALKLWEYTDDLQSQKAFFDIAVADYDKGGITFTIDCVINHEGWHFEIFNREREINPQKYLETLQSEFNGSCNNQERLVLDNTIEIEANESDVADAMARIINALVNRLGSSALCPIQD